MIFAHFLCFRRSIYFGLVSLDELQRYAYPIFQSTCLYSYSYNQVIDGFIEFMMGVWAWVCYGLAGIWQGFGGMGLDLAQVWQWLRNNIEVVNLAQFCIYKILRMTCQLIWKTPLWEL